MFDCGPPSTNSAKIIAKHPFRQDRHRCYHVAVDLQRFFPYRLARLADAVSRATAQVYAERFDLTRDEWRVLAALEQLGEVRTSAVMESSTLDKMQVSRAVNRMERSGLLARTPDPADGRGYLLRLTPRGRALHARIVPMVRAREAFLLEALTSEQRAALEAALDAVQERAGLLLRQG
jgi:DNA-binding MarR family transcriptional regulator